MEKKKNGVELLFKKFWNLNRINRNKIKIKDRYIRIKLLKSKDK